MHIYPELISHYTPFWTENRYFMEILGKETSFGILQMKPLYYKYLYYISLLNDFFPLDIITTIMQLFDTLLLKNFELYKCITCTTADCILYSKKVIPSFGLHDSYSCDCCKNKMDPFDKNKNYQKGRAHTDRCRKGWYDFTEYACDKCIADCNREICEQYDSDNDDW